MLKDMIPWKKSSGQLSQKQSDLFSQLHRRMNDVFENFWNEFNTPFSKSLTLPETEGWFKAPDIDIEENDKEIRIVADLPGLDEKDLEVSLDGDLLVIKGERKEKHEEKNATYYVSERRSGSFQRVIPIPGNEVDKNKLSASLKKGVLKVTLPKIPGKTSSHKKIEIKSEE